MSDSMNQEPIVTGGTGQPVSAPKGRRFAAGVIDLIIIPILLGIIAGVALLGANEAVRNGVLIVTNIAWMLFRDAVYSPGRTMVGLKLISLSGEKPTLSQALIRNILLIVPFVLLVGYIVEIISLISKGTRVADAWAKTSVVEV